MFDIVSISYHYIGNLTAVDSNAEIFAKRFICGGQPLYLQVVGSWGADHDVLSEMINHEIWINVDSLGEAGAAVNRSKRGVQTSFGNVDNLAVNSAVPSGNAQCIVLRLLGGEVGGVKLVVGYQVGSKLMEVGVEVEGQACQEEKGKE